MSYDVMVFDPQAPPSDREGFMGWYREQTQWGEGHTYNDPAISTAELRAWFFDMIREYPPMNGPHALTTWMIPSKPTTQSGNR